MQVMRWLGTRGTAVRKLQLSVRKANTWPLGAAKLLALMPNLESLAVRDKSGRVFRPADDLKSLRRLSSLQTLSLHFGPREVAFSQRTTSRKLHHLTSLKSLTLEVHTYNPDASFRLSRHLTDLTCLTHLDVSCNTSNNVPRLVPRLTSLRNLSLTYYMDNLPASFANLYQLQSLDLAILFNKHGPAFSLPDAFSTCQELSHLRLDGLPRATLGEWPHFCESLLRLPSLRSLHIEDVDLSCLENQGWCFPSQLQSLVLSECSLETYPAALCSLASLTSLDLCMNYLTRLPAGPYLARLHTLDISSNESLTKFRCLAAATSLRTLVLGKVNPVDSRDVAAVLPPTCSIDLMEDEYDDEDE